MLTRMPQSRNDLKVDIKKYIELSLRRVCLQNQKRSNTCKEALESHISIDMAQKFIQARTSNSYARRYRYLDIISQRNYNEE